MKRLKFVLTALILVMGLGLTVALTVPHNEKAVEVQQDLYWYEWNGTTLGNQIGTSAVSKNFAMSETGCPTITEPDCARGYTEPQTPNAPPIDTHQDFLSEE
ncbi:hypothetical protein KZP23_04700 [Echinicola marina]|uniref:hypothetical protein n=1 Tax=Echinicola marina TaxID=2859768 RepID=UPI001CF676BF|nr:hypothetical protein [Echinicola marina]UCS94333.1 hypothetical protein KZP23_04700 [Echinicola marina]